MKKIDALAESVLRHLARRTSRRGLMAKIGAAVAGASAVPLLPVARASSGNAPEGEGSPGVGARSMGNIQDPGDPSKCDYWRYCAIDGYLCECCGGSPNSCPPGTEMSPITWIGTCRNPADGRNYIISYNDCCGAPQCNRCFCNRNEGDRPIARPQDNNDFNWCLGTSSSSYTCSAALVVGVALEDTK